MAPKSFGVKSFNWDYAAKLKDAFVILDSDERAATISKGAHKLAEKEGLTLVDDEALLAENAGLTEWPVPLIGAFDEDFLSVPPEGARHVDEGASEMLFSEKGRCARQPLHAGR